MSSFRFADDPKCTQGALCGKNVTGKNGTVVHACYADSDSIASAKCDNDTKACDLPDDAEADGLACGYIKNATTNLTHMCIDRKYCTGDANAQVSIDYFGTNMTLQCSAVRTVLAMGAALVSTYYAM